MTYPPIPGLAGESGIRPMRRRRPYGEPGR